MMLLLLMMMIGRPADVPAAGRRGGADGQCNRSHPGRQPVVPRVDHQRRYVRWRRLRACILRADDGRQQQRRQRQRRGWHRQPDHRCRLEHRGLHPRVASVYARRSRQTAAGLAREPVSCHRPTLQVGGLAFSVFHLHYRCSPLPLTLLVALSSLYVPKLLNFINAFNC